MTLIKTISPRIRRISTDCHPMCLPAMIASEQAASLYILARNMMARMNPQMRMTPEIRNPFRMKNVTRIKSKVCRSSSGKCKQKKKPESKKNWRSGRGKWNSKGEKPKNYSM